jgi:hypothetical protein
MNDDRDHNGERNYDHEHGRVIEDGPLPIRFCSIFLYQIFLSL